jgi:xanthine dehydrogenase small subunit
LTKFILNNTEIETDLPNGTTLLDFIRYEKNLKGTKIGCREGDCGACSILVGSLEDDNVQYQSATSCLMAIGNAASKHIVTIEGINDTMLTPVQAAFAENNASQCGFCTPGFIMSLTGCCINKSIINNETAIASMDGNICRCTGYQSIKLAAKDVVGFMQQNNAKQNIDFAIEHKIVPQYFNGIANRLKDLQTEADIKSDFHFILGGGTDLYVQKHADVVDANLHFATLKNKNYIVEKDGEIEIGAGTNVSYFAESAIIKNAFPNLAAIIKLVSSTPIRNMATFTGNFINASPIGDFTIFFLTLKTTLHFQNTTTNTTRTVLLKDFYKGYKNIDKLFEEELTHFTFTKPTANTFFNFEKVSKRTHLDIASVNTACAAQINEGVISEISISAGGVGPVPMLLSKTNAFLLGKKITEENINEALQIVQTEIAPISDARGTAAYKALLLQQLIKLHFELAIQSK